MKICLLDRSEEVSYLGKKIYDYLKNNGGDFGELSLEEVAAKLDMSLSSLKRGINELIKKRIIFKRCEYGLKTYSEITISDLTNIIMELTPYDVMIDENGRASLVKVMPGEPTDLPDVESKSGYYTARITGYRLYERF